MGPKKTDPCRAVLLKGKEHNEDEAGQGDDKGLGGCGGDLQTFDCGEHRDGGCDDAIPVKKSRPEDGGRHHEGLQVPPEVGSDAQDDRQEREDSPFSMVVGLEDEANVFDADHDDEGPEDEGGHAQDIDIVHGQGVVPMETLADRVEGAGPYVSVNHAEGGNGKGKALFPNLPAGWGPGLRREGDRPGYIARGFGHVHIPWEGDGLWKSFRYKAREP